MSGALHNPLVSSLAILALVFAGLALLMTFGAVRKAIRHIRMKRISYISTEDATKLQTTRRTKRPVPWWRDR